MRRRSRNYGIAAYATLIDVKFRQHNTGAAKPKEKAARVPIAQFLQSGESGPIV